MIIALSLLTGLYFAVNIIGFMIFNNDYKRNKKFNEIYEQKKVENLQTTDAHGNDGKTPVKKEAQEKSIPLPIAKEIRQLKAIQKQINSISAPSSKETAQMLGSLLFNVEELFKRNKTANGTLAVDYKEKLSKLCYLTGEQYYIDIINNPSFWTDTETKISEVKTSIQSFTNETTEKIKEITEETKLDAKIANKTFTQKERIKIQDLYQEMPGERK